MELPPHSIMAAGPVIIENGQVLLNKERAYDGHITLWYFPGGEVEDFKLDLTETCRREVKEEVGLDIEIIRPLKTTLGQKPNGAVVVLVHYLAKRSGKITPGPDIVEWDWHDIHNLPPDCAPNVYEVIKDYIQSEGL